MDALDLLIQRRSIAKLISPAPADKVLENIIQAGLRAPDHGGLTPWRFVIIENEGLQKFSTLLKNTAAIDGADTFSIERAKQLPFRAPMIITVIAKTKQHIKVPVSEQYLSAGCAVYAMQMAAVAQGFQGIWRTGNWAYHDKIREAFGAEGEDEIVGFLYLGTPDCEPAAPPLRLTEKFVSYW